MTVTEITAHQLRERRKGMLVGAAFLVGAFLLVVVLGIALK